MRYALKGAVKSEAKKTGDLGVCHGCEAIVKGRKNSKNKGFHWYHKKLDNCDSRSQPMSDWHREWQDHWPICMREVVFHAGGLKKIADVVTLNEVVLEFQHSPISKSEIREREAVYKKLIWVFDATLFGATVRVTKMGVVEVLCRNAIRLKNYISTIESFFFIDFGEFLFLVKKRQVERPRFIAILLEEERFFSDRPMTPIKCFAEIMRVGENAVRRKDGYLLGAFFDKKVFINKYAEKSGKLAKR